ncbi:MAG: hypothetical protein MRZ79_26760 [Bacteroidia bacterium]|nr:hypothetical protein [Bacteroidia bacterium]
MSNRILFLLFAWMSCGLLFAQTPDSTAQDDDLNLSEFDDFDFGEVEVKTYASSKIIGISPQQLISLGYDFQGPYQASFSSIGSFEDGATVPQETYQINSTQGVRLVANIPVYSRNSLIVQVGANIWDLRYQFDVPDDQIENDVARSISQNGLRTGGINTTIFKPFNETRFLLFQGSADLSGDYTLSNFQSLNFLRFSAAALYGWRTSDYFQWAVGMSRTYRVGEMNYIPVVLINWTSQNSPWGVESLLPARAHVRYTFSPRNMLFAGFELEGQSYRINGVSETLNNESLEIRRGEMRWRLMWQRQLTGFIWLQAQAGYRINWSYNADALPEGNEFFRGFFGNQQYAMLNSLTNPFYANISVNLVSP